MSFRAAMWAALVPLILRLRHLVPLSRGRWIGGVRRAVRGQRTAMLKRAVSEQTVVA